jgi:hypothetical protein
MWIGVFISNSLNCAAADMRQIKQTPRPNVACRPGAGEGGWPGTGSQRWAVKLTSGGWSVQQSPVVGRRRRAGSGVCCGVGKMGGARVVKNLGRPKFLQSSGLHEMRPWSCWLFPAREKCPAQAEVVRRNPSWSSPDRAIVREAK